MKSRIRVGLASLVVMILVATGLLMFLPSSKDANRIRVLKELDKNYREIDPTSLSPLWKANWITFGNNFAPLRRDEAAVIVVWAPVPGSTDAIYGMQEIFHSLYIADRTKLWKKMILVAPHPGSTGWTLFGKMLLANQLQRKMPNDLFDCYGQLSANPKKGIAMLQHRWNLESAEIRAKVERQLEENRAIYYDYQKAGIVFQTGTGKYFSLSDLTSERALRMVGNVFPYFDPPQ